MRISPLNLILPLYLGYIAFSLLQLREEQQMRLYQLVNEFKIWHLAIAIGIIVIDILFRALFPDTKKLWLAEGVAIIVIGGIIQVFNIITPTSLFH